MKSFGEVTGVPGSVFLHQFSEIFLKKTGSERSDFRIDIVGVGAPQVAVDPLRIIQLRRMIFPYFEQYRPVVLCYEKCDPTILALKQVRRRIVLMLAAGSLHHPAFRRIVEGDMFVQRHTGLNRRIDVRADTARLTLPQSQRHSIGGE
jgi:hypothetical protein